MINLLLELFKFWYSSSFENFIRVWTNTINFLDEDLAVGLMFKLLFVPLFHDSSIFGKIMSFIFRSLRIFMGLFAFVLSSFIILSLAFFWFLLPFLGLIPSFSAISLFIKLSFVFGVTLFLRRLNLPLKKVWQIKDEKDLWSATKIKREEIVWFKFLELNEIKELLWNLEVEVKNFTNFSPIFTESLLPRVFNLVINSEAQYVTSVYFFVSLLSNIPSIEQELLKLNLTLDNFEQALLFLEFKKNKYRQIFIWDEEFEVTHLKGVNRGWLGAPTPTLDSVSLDLTKEALKSREEPFIGRINVVSQVVNILSKEKDRSVMLVGLPGSGKSSLIGYLASKIIAGDAPATLATKRLVKLDLTRLLSGIRSEGELAEKIKNIFEEVKFVKEIIVFVDEIHNLGLGEASGNFNLFGLLMPYLDQNEFQFIATTEEENYERIILKNAAFARLFTKIELPPATEDETKKIIFERSFYLEKYKSIKITYIAIDTLVNLSSKIIHDRVLPDSALSILAEVQVLSKEITSKLIKDDIGKRVNIPLEEIGNVQKGELLNLEKLIHQKLIGQEEAVSDVSKTLRRAAVSLREGTRPIGSFLFVGPTGVGKTELAKILAEVYFSAGSAGSPGVFFRFDMSEYQGNEGVNRFIGDAQNPGELTESIRNKPYALILFDEFEKANPRILNLFLQILDDGRLTDASGTAVDFTNTIIIVTSNAGSLLIAQGIEKGKTIEQLTEPVRNELLKTFKPELVNRFDEIVIFKPLTQTELEKIVVIKLEELKKLLKDKGFLVEFAPSLISELAKKGFDPVLGARPMRRLIQDTIEARLSVMILEGKLAKGESIEVGVDYLK